MPKSGSFSGRGGSGSIFSSIHSISIIQVVGQGLSPALRVYHCLDPVAGAFDARHGVLSEAQIVQRADLVICSSKQLFREKVSQNPRTYFVPNAADVEHSRKALDPELAVSSLLQQIPLPRIGYVGSIDHRMDFRLLKEVSGSHPDKSFVLIGPILTEVPTDIASAANIYFPGKIAYSEMPAVLKGFQVCIIPFKKDEISATVFPLKLFEYLGAGKPVVMSDFNPDLLDFTKNTAVSCGQSAEFSRAVQTALDSNSPARNQERIQVASENTWKHRGEVIAQLLLNAMQDPSTP